MKDANELFGSMNGNAPAIFRQLVDEAELKPAVIVAPASPTPRASAITRDGNALILTREERRIALACIGRSWAGCAPR